MTLLKVNKPITRNFNWFDEVFNEFNPAFSKDWNLTVPPVNITETASAYQVTLSVPGRNKEDFKTVVDKGLLTISYEKKAEAANEDVKSVRNEFSFQSFKRSFTLDDTIDTEKIEAKYETGLLTFILPKKEQAQQLAKQISIQ